MTKNGWSESGFNCAWYHELVCEFCGFKTRRYLSGDFLIRDGRHKGCIRYSDQNKTEMRKRKMHRRICP